MRLKEVILKYFRCFKDEVIIKIDDLTAFIGKNDTGKSPVLDALDIFFNNDIVKIEQLDSCVYSDQNEVIIV